MIRIDHRNQVGSVCTTWRRGSLWLQVRHSYDTAHGPVWVAEVLRVVAYHGKPGAGFYELRTIQRGTYHSSRQRAVRAGMRAFQKAVRS